MFSSSSQLQQTASPVWTKLCVLPHRRRVPRTLTNNNAHGVHMPRMHPHIPSRRTGAMCATHVVKNVPLLSLPWSSTMFHRAALDWPDPAHRLPAAASAHLLRGLVRGHCGAALFIVSHWNIIKEGWLVPAWLSNFTEMWRWRILYKIGYTYSM